MAVNKQRVLVLGATGMLGSTVFRFFSSDENYDTYGTLRSTAGLENFLPKLCDNLITNIRFDSEADLISLFTQIKPDVVINCVGIIKQKPAAYDYLESLNINATLPHRLKKYCALINARLIHFSTDCVFSGQKGNYTETDFADASDLYGRTKYLGEVFGDGALTLRTSIIGHELISSKSLIDWFLSQSGTINGFKKAIFSGLPTIEVARVLQKFVLPNHNLSGLYHLSVEPINKYELLNLVSAVYHKQIQIRPDENLVIDRSLNSNRFQLETGFVARPWPELIKDMYEDYKNIGMV